jgi:hypothetical protein
MFPVRRPTARIPTLAAVAAIAVLTLASVPALAKGPILEATFVDPISFDSPPGAELLVAITVAVDEAFEGESAAGAPVWLRLIGPAGDTTVAAGSIGKGAGRYEMRIKVPEGGPRQAEVYMPGGPGEADIQLWLTNDPFTFRPMGAGTAQLAPALAPRAPLANPPAAPIATKAAPPPVASVEAPVTALQPAPVDFDPLLVGLAALATATFVIAAAVGIRRAGRPAPVVAAEASTQAPGA